MTATRSAPIDTTPVELEAAISFEAAEAHAWADLYAAAPPAWAAAAGLDTRRIDDTLVLSWGATGRRYFSRAIGLGVIAPATEDAIDRILGLWRESGIEMFLLQSLPHCRPAGYEEWLRERGLEPFDVQDRIVRGDAPAAKAHVVPAGREILVEEVRPDTAEEWSLFLQRVYGLDVGPWLPLLIGRWGWHQYVAREDGEIVAARGMHIGPEGTAWLGMDGPVPGLMTEDHMPDAMICARIIADGLTHGARRFVADIEAPSREMDTPAYELFAELGFGRPYARTHWTVL